MFDAVLVPGRRRRAPRRWRATAMRVHFVLEAYKHCKAICTVGEGVQLLATLGVGADPAKAPGRRGGGRDAGHQPRRHHARPRRSRSDFVAAIAKHRHWDRANIEAVPA